MKTFQQLRRLGKQRRTTAFKPMRGEMGRLILQDALGYPNPAEHQTVSADETPARVDKDDNGDALAPDLATAIHASQGSGQGLPTEQRSLFEASLGASLGHVRIHTDGLAAQLSGKLAARAFTAGSDVFFNAGEYRPGTGQGRYLLAHELAHVVQQQYGVRPDSGTGQVGDAHERGADAVAARAVRGDSAVGLLPGSRTVAPAATAPVVQRFAEIVGQPYDRLSDDGKMAVVDHGREAWAESGNIANSNKVLDNLKAKPKIEELSGKDISVAPPGKTTKITLKKFRMTDRAAGGDVELTDDCGTANQEILGAGAAGYESFVGVNQRGSTQEYTSPSKYEGDDNAAGGLVSTTERMSGEIYIRIFAREFKKTLSRTDALKEWDKLSASEQDRLSKKYGINKYAAPKVGQGVTIGSERDMPGASETGYNFHFGFNLMASGYDYITLEDYASSGVKYYFDMYGPVTKGQAWGQASSNVDAVDDKFTALVVQHPESLKGIANAEGVHLEADPATPTGKKTIAKGTQLIIIRKGASWMKVEVKSGPSAGQSGWIMNQYFTDT